jgi:hypothetical protein
MNWEKALQATEVTPEQMSAGNIAREDHARFYAGSDAPDTTQLAFLRACWPEWGDRASAAVMARLRALDDLKGCGGLDGIDLVEGAVLTAAATAPIFVIDFAWALDWPRFIAIAVDANRAELQGLGILPMDEDEAVPPDAANDAQGDQR